MPQGRRSLAADQAKDVLDRLCQYLVETGISIDWLMTGWGPKTDLGGQLILSPPSEDHWPMSPPVPDTKAEIQSEQRDYLRELMSPDLDRNRYRVTRCRYCGTEFRQFLENPADLKAAAADVDRLGAIHDSWSPVCCRACSEDRVGIPNRAKQRRPTPAQWSDLGKWLGVKNESPAEKLEEALVRAGFRPRARPDNIELLRQFKALYPQDPIALSWKLEPGAIVSDPLGAARLNAR